MPQFKLTSDPLPPDSISVSNEQWLSPHWQLTHSLKTRMDFENYFQLNENEIKAFVESENVFNIRCTPYYARLASDNPNSPIRKILMPDSKELFSPNQEMQDPLDENNNRPTNRIIHRYSDRALLLITDFCSVYCRYCTRKHFTGNDQILPKAEELKQALNYLKSHPGIKEVILSGGDPLTLSDSILDRILFEIRKIDSVEIIRIGSRMPVVCPQRMTSDLAEILKKYKPVYLMTHFNHPKEITYLAAEKLDLIADHGVPMMNQMVLLNAVNNHPAIIQALSRRLLYFRVKPYYMFQCDPSKGTDHLRTSIYDSMEIQKELWGHLSGLAMPNFAVDIPNGGGKVYYSPNFEFARTQNSILFKGWDGVKGEYINPPKEEINKPIDFEDYLSEWNQIKDSKKAMSYI